MGTQAVVSITRNDNTVIKAICGCSGYNAERLAQAIRENFTLSPDRVYYFALDVGFGCRDCLVVLSEMDAVYEGDEELMSSYRETFSNPRWNPRWDRGTAAYTILVEYP